MNNTLKHIDRLALESINFENPSQVDADKLQELLWNQADVRPTYSGYFHGNNDNLLAYGWRIEYNESINSLVVAYSYQRRRPFKKTVTANSYVIEFWSADKFLACRPGGRVIYNYEEQDIWEQVINPIMRALGFEYNRDGECLRPGAESGWGD